jgi:hypothetical protein
MEALKMINAGIRFLLELSLLAALGYWGFSSQPTTLLKILLGIGLPVVVAILWGIFVSPKAAIQVSAPLHLILEITLLGLGSAALFLSQKPTLAWIYSILVILNKILLVVWKQ